MAEQVQYYGTGRRKSSVARVFLRPGSGEFKVNGKAFDQHFVTEAQRIMAKSPLVATETTASFNVICTVSGGGVNGQAARCAWALRARCRSSILSCAPS